MSLAMQLAVLQIEPKANMTDEPQVIPLGSKVRDPISGFQGVATMRNAHLHSTAQIGVEAQILDKDSKPIPAVWFEEARLEVIS